MSACENRRLDYLDANEIPGVADMADCGFMNVRLQKSNACVGSTQPDVCR